VPCLGPRSSSFKATRLAVVVLLVLRLVVVVAAVVRVLSVGCRGRGGSRGRRSGNGSRLARRSHEPCVPRSRGSQQCRPRVWRAGGGDGQPATSQPVFPNLRFSGHIVTNRLNLDFGALACGIVPLVFFSTLCKMKVEILLGVWLLTYKLLR